MLKIKLKRVTIICLSLCMILMILSGCSSQGGDKPTKNQLIVEYFNSLKKVPKIKKINAELSSYEDMVKYLQSKGYISEDAKPVDINSTKGYVKDQTGGKFTQTNVADKAYDYNGLWLLWWNQVNKTSNYDNYSSMKNNNGVIALGGGAAILNTSAVNGSFAVAFASNYAKKDAVITDFKSIDNKADTLAYMDSTLSLANLFKEKGYISNPAKFTDLETTYKSGNDVNDKNNQVSFAATSWSYADGVTIFYFGAEPSGAAYVNYLNLEKGGHTITGYTSDSKGRYYSAMNTKYKNNLKATKYTYHVDAYYKGFAISFDGKKNK